MSELVFYTHPMSRGRIVRWMLEETGAPYEQVLLEYERSMKAADYLAINPMGKVPAIVHKGRTVTECAAICAYLADAFPEADLAPAPADRTDYYRWMFFVAGPVEAAFSNNAAGWTPAPDQEKMFGYGTFERTVDTLAGAVKGRKFVAGERFSAADVYVGSVIDVMLQFKLMASRPAFDDYLGPLRERPAYKRAAQIDDDLIATMKAANPD